MVAVFEEEEEVFTVSILSLRSAYVGVNPIYFWKGLGEEKLRLQDPTEVQCPLLRDGEDFRLLDQG